MPNTFQRPMFMSFCPPFTEAYLQEEKDDTDEHTDRITAVRSQIQADREIDQRTEKGLRHVIRQTHLPINNTFSWYKGPKAIAVIIKVFIQKREFSSEEINSFLRPINIPSINNPQVCTYRPAPTAQSKLAFCPNVTFCQMKFHKSPRFVCSAISAYIAPTPKLGN